MHAVIRTYSGAGAKELFDLLEERKAEVDGLMRSIDGFVNYLLVRTSDGGTSVTICHDRLGTDESVRRAKKWISSNASNFRTPEPRVTEGPVIVQLSADTQGSAAAIPLSNA